MADEKTKPTPEKLADVDFGTPTTDLFDLEVTMRPGTYNYAAVPASAEYLDLPHVRKWNPSHERSLWAPLPESPPPEGFS